MTDTKLPVLSFFSKKHLKLFTTVAKNFFPNEKSLIKSFHVSIKKFQSQPLFIQEKKHSRKCNFISF